MDNCNVLIVGGGPSGSSLAWSLRDSGLNVVIMDKQHFPRNKTCAGWITPSVIKTLQLDLNDYGRERVLQPVYGFRVGQIGAETVEVGYSPAPASYGIRRCEFDHYLLQRSGAKLLQGVAVKDIRRENDHWIVNDAIRTRLLVGAGGHFCPVARYLGARPGQAETAVMAQEIEFKMTPEQRATCNIDPEKPELFFCPDLKGYGWILIKGDYLNIGLGREDRHKLSAHVEQFCDFLKASGRIGFDIPGGFNGHAYLLYQHAERQTLMDGLLLIGDSAGLAYTQSGEGIRPAIESGLIAGDIIIGAKNDYSANNLAAYNAMIEKRFGHKYRDAGLTSMLPERIKQYMAGHAMKSSWFVRHILIDRWFLHTDLPPLVAGG